MQALGEAATLRPLDALKTDRATRAAPENGDAVLDRPNSSAKR
jgi:hypothetical protein